MAVRESDESDKRKPYLREVSIKSTETLRVNVKRTLGCSEKVIITASVLKHVDLDSF